MASSRDDFIIAIRSAFLKKTTKQKFSLLTLIFLSVSIIFLSSFNFKVINNLRSMSQGRAQYTMQFSHYEKVPQNVQDEVTKKLA